MTTPTAARVKKAVSTFTSIGAFTMVGSRLASIASANARNPVHPIIASQIATWEANAPTNGGSLIRRTRRSIRSLNSLVIEFSTLRLLSISTSSKITSRSCFAPERASKVDKIRTITLAPAAISASLMPIDTTAWRSQAVLVQPTSSEPARVIPQHIGGPATLLVPPTDCMCCCGAPGGGESAARSADPGHVPVRGHAAHDQREVRRALAEVRHDPPMEGQRTGGAAD